MIAETKPAGPMVPRSTGLGRRIRPRWREWAASALLYSGALSLARRLTRDREWRRESSDKRARLHRIAGPRFVILCYHRVGAEGVPFYSTLPPAVFEVQMRHVRRNYRVLSLGELCRELREPRDLRPAVVVTFDDGYRDLYAFAYPVLRALGIPATIFAVAGAIETGRAPWYDRLFLMLAESSESAIEVELGTVQRFELRSRAERLTATQEIVRWLRTQSDTRRREFCEALARRIPVREAAMENRMLTWKQLEEMQAHGVVCGSHTISHPVMGRLARSEMLVELNDSKRILEQRLGRPVLDFAFPFGQPPDCEGVTEKDLRHSGYRSAMTTVPGVNRPGVNPYALRRVSIGEERHFPMFAYQLNKLFLDATDAESPELSRGSLLPPVARTSVMLSGER